VPAYPVAVIGYKLQEVEGLVATGHLQVQLPCTARIAADKNEDEAKWSREQMSMSNSARAWKARERVQ
jgi:hypothetical protein